MVTSRSRAGAGAGARRRAHSDSASSAAPRSAGLQLQWPSRLTTHRDTTVSLVGGLVLGGDVDAGHEGGVRKGGGARLVGQQHGAAHEDGRERRHRLRQVRCHAAAPRTLR
eukprot:TRINITY_DN968_c0_g1_i5.p4 TRINITY_DN968_c0_g1~~TRINITY_DN968_c0_g1_i5.p4  ORF type:complete len:111 (+),score=10.94 TRINITY_DN968_c0_g1_i5:382-714(+)